MNGPSILSIVPRQYVGALYVAAVLLALAVPNLHAAERSRTRRVADDKTFDTVILPIVKKYCVDCHGEDDPKGKVSFEDLEKPSQILENREVWVKAFKHLGIGGMPPTNKKRRPTRAQEQAFVEWLDLKLFHCDCDGDVDPGRETIQRLNRTEYTNTVRDLIGIETDVAKDFPSDDLGYGFSNIGDVLSLPPLLFEKYVGAAEKIAAAAVLTESLENRKKRLVDAQLKITGGVRATSEGWKVLYSSGSVYGDYEATHSGQYVIRFSAMADQAGPQVARMQVRVDGKSVKVFDVPDRRKERTFEVRRHLNKGRHRLEGAFINDYYQPKAKNPHDRDRNLAIRSIEVQGPIGVEPPSSHRKIVFTRPSKEKSVAQAAREIVARLLPRAFRRSVSRDEIDRYASVVELAVSRGDSFERGVQIAVQAILVSPHFLFRVELDPQPDNATSHHRISDFELASRLSYFLWSTMPDEELFGLAREGSLHERKVLDKQVSRMLADPKADALIENFASQWLNLGNLVEVKPDAKLFPQFTPELRADMIRETKLFIRSVFREDRSILDFLDGDFTFVNERLAKHYGIKGVNGEKMRRVSLPTSQRAGVLTHASILTLTSNPNRTSLVKRGAWIVNNVLGLLLPDPPAVVQSLEDGAKESGVSTLREQLALHRAKAACASCHNTLDPLGFGMENFDAIGRWRESSEGKPVEAGGTMPSGESFSGPVDLVKILKRRRMKFAKLVTRKMLTYALGRGLEIPDSCTVDDILDDLEQNDFRFTVLVRGIVNSRPFLYRRGESAARK